MARETYEELVKKHFPGTQVVEVKFPQSDKTYSYIGSGNLRTNQTTAAPVTHPTSGKNYMVPDPPGVKIVATHSIADAKVGDKTGVVGNKVTSIPTGLKYLPGAREAQQNREINTGGLNMRVDDYLAKFKGGANETK